MSLKGRLKKENFGFSMPVDAPTYDRPPALMREMESFTISYETCTDAALALLPEADGLELASPGVARMVFARLPYTPWGSYNEIYQMLDCLWQGEPIIFPVRLLVDNEVALTIGRELWGNPKKFGHITFSRDSSIIQCTGERPKGHKVCSGLMQLGQPLELEPAETKVLGFRVIPNPENPDEPSVAELLMNTLHVRPLQAWTGPCSLSFPETSELDPWYKLPVKKLLGAVYTVSDMETSPSGKILKRF